MRSFLFIVLILSSCSITAAQKFIGHSGVYYLGSANLPMPQSVYNLSNINGVAVRTRWENLEISPGVFDWTFLDGEIQKARYGDKKISISILAAPAWLNTSLGAETYQYLDENKFHATYGDTLSGYITWDPIYVARLKSLILALSEKYESEEVISYFNLVSGQMSRNLPDTIVDEMGKHPFHEAYDYISDTLVKKMREVLDVYMTAFPATPLWSTIDYQTFEPLATGHAKNYVAHQYATYGIATYPDRFGLWREDLSGCNPKISTLQPSSHWHIMKENPCRGGAQMLWSVQDGPDRMNQCDILPNTEVQVLDSAIRKGLFMGMRYLEIYGADINDLSLSALIQKANSLLVQEGNGCTIMAISRLREPKTVSVFPNPFYDTVSIKFNSMGDYTLQVFNVQGDLLHWEKVSNVFLHLLDLSHIPSGILIVKLIEQNRNETFRIVKQ
jgi:hypothetical protein